MAGTFQITVGGTFPPLISLRDYDVDTDNMIIPAAYNTAGTDTGIEILGKKCRRESHVTPWKHKKTCA